MHERGHRLWPLRALRVIATYEMKNFMNEPIPAWLRDRVLGEDNSKVSHVIDLTEDDGVVPDGKELIDLLDDSLAPLAPPPADDVKLEDLVYTLDFE